MNATLEGVCHGMAQGIAALQVAMTTAGLDPKEWPLLLAATGALTAPGAYLQGAAAAQAADPQQGTTDDAKANLAQDQQDAADPTQRSSHRGGRRHAA